MEIFPEHPNTHPDSPLQKIIHALPTDMNLLEYMEYVDKRRDSFCGTVENPEKVRQYNELCDTLIQLKTEWNIQRIKLEERESDSQYVVAYVDISVPCELGPKEADVIRRSMAIADSVHLASVQTADNKSVIRFSFSVSHIWLDGYADEAPSGAKEEQS